MPVDMRVITPSVAASLKHQLVHEREKFSQEAEFASKLIQAWGILGEPDGETGSGHQRFVPISPRDLVDRAVVVTKLAFEAFRGQGWLIDMAPIDDLLDGEEHKTGFLHSHGPLNLDDDIPF